MSFVHLHRHSEFSLLDGIGNAKQYAERAAELGQSALALTDHGTLSGSLHHIKACNDVGILPISGVEAYFKPDRHAQDADHKRCWHMVLLAKNLTGWKNLIKITSEAYASGFYYKPCIDYDLLEKYHEGLIATTACMGSYFCQGILGNDIDWQIHFWRMRDLFKDDFYFEIMPHDFPEQKLLNVELVNMAEEMSVPLLATCDVHYPYQEWAETQDIALMIRTAQTEQGRKKKKLEGDDVYEFDSKTLYLMDEATLEREFKTNHPDINSSYVRSAIDNTQSLLSNFNFFTVDRSAKLPNIADQEERSVEEIIWGWCEEGLARINKSDDEAYRERLDYEYEILQRKGVLGYFYIIGDVVRWAKGEHIRIGPGRGSAAGCLVSYLVGITAIDPIGHKLLFERFLNPDRQGLPDIDIDVQHNRRDELKQYLADKWGKENVADIVTHQTYGAKSAIADVSRVLDVPYKEVIDVTKTIEDKTEDTLAEIAEGNESLGQFFTRYPRVRDHSCRLEGQIKAISKHPAGIVVADKPVPSYMPTMRAKDGSSVTGWSDRPDFPIISDFGFLKLDLLSTDGLTKQQDAIDLTGKEIDLDKLLVCQDPESVDSEVMDGFRRGLNLGIFQFQGRGITNLLRRIRPTDLSDIAAANALYRPGPLEGGIASAYGEIKNGRVKAVYWHDSVRPYMTETYGLMIYQEQVMQIVQSLAGFSAGEADDFRKAIGKLYRLPGGAARKYMEKYRQRWLDGTRSLDIGPSVSEGIWEKILAFGGYGFNKSHSVSYSVQGYQDMWLKTKHPKEFYSALLSHEPDKAEAAIREAKAIDVHFLPPSINKSNREFTIDEEGIRFGLVAVKHVGDAALNQIIRYQPFSSFEDFELKVQKKKCNKKVKDALIAVGAFDEFGMRNEWTFEEMEEAERELLGVSLRISTASEELLKVIDEHVYTEEEYDALEEEEAVVVGGEVVNIKKIFTRKGDPMAFADLVHRTNQYSCTIFPNVYDQIMPILESNEPIILRGRKDDRGAVIAFSATTAKYLQEALAQTA